MLSCVFTLAALPCFEVVVHCAKSQQRGPASAALLKQRLQELGLAGNKEVVVMEGGYNRYGELYSSDPIRTEHGPPQQPLNGQH